MISPGARKEGSLAPAVARFAGFADGVESVPDKGRNAEMRAFAEPGSRRNKHADSGEAARVEMKAGERRGDNFVPPPVHSSRQRRLHRVFSDF